MEEQVEDIMQFEPQDNAEDYVAKARIIAENGCYFKAFDLYLTAVEKWPHVRENIELEVRELLESFNRYLVNTGKKVDIFYNFERAIAAFPNSALLLNDIGKYLYKFMFLNEAIQYLYQALDIDTSLVSAEQNLNSIKNLLVPRWHYRMLNDTIRNSAFKQALHEVIIPDVDKVLDIGTGTGLLSLFARECSPEIVVACEGSELMASIAEMVFKENKMNDYLFIDKDSTEISTCNMGGKQSVVVTELFDAGLLGEKVLQTLEHGWKNLFLPNAKIIPAWAEFFVVGVRCDNLSLLHRLTTSAKESIGLKQQEVRICTSEPYDAEDINFFDHLEYITKPQTVFKINFNLIKDIKYKLYNSKHYCTNLQVIKDGEVNCIIGWFNLHLTESIMITTDPRNENRAKAWQQAIFNDFTAKTVKEGECLPFNFTTHGGKVVLHAEDNENVERVSLPLLRFLNDSENIRAIEEAVNVANVYLSQFDELEYLNVIDFSVFPLIGLQLLKRGVNAVTCMTTNYQDKEFILKVFKENGISSSRIKILMEEDVTVNSFRGRTYHLIVSNLLLVSGDVNIKQKEILRRLIHSNLVEDGMVIPYRILIEAQLISCDWIENSNILNDKNVFDYNIGNFINKFQVSQNYYVDMTNIEYTEMSEVVQLGDYCYDLDNKAIPVKINREGKVNCTLCWYKIQYIEDYEPVLTKRAGSFINNTAFRSFPLLEVSTENETHILRCVDDDQSFKLLTHVESPDV